MSYKSLWPDIVLTFSCFAAIRFENDKQGTNTSVYIKKTF